MALSKEERERLEKLKESIEKLLKKDEEQNNKEPDWMDYGPGGGRREW